MLGYDAFTDLGFLKADTCIYSFMADMPLVPVFSKSKFDQFDVKEIKVIGAFRELYFLLDWRICI